MTAVRRRTWSSAYKKSIDCSNPKGFSQVNHCKHKAKNATSKRPTKKAQRDRRLVNAGVSGYNRPRATPDHPTKSHIVVAKVGDQVKTIRFGQQGVKTNQTVGQRQAFASRHRANIAKGPMSAAYWANRVKWNPRKTKSQSKKWVKGS